MADSALIATQIDPEPPISDTQPQIQKFHQSALDTQALGLEALRLRTKEHLTFDEIAERLGMANRSVAHRLVKKLLDRESFEEVELYRHEQYGRLMEILSVLRPVIMDEPSQWAIDEMAPRDLEVKTNRWHGAIDRTVKVEDRLSKLLGLDKPVKVEHSGTIGLDAKVQAVSIIDSMLRVDEEPIIELEAIEDAELTDGETDQ